MSNQRGNNVVYVNVEIYNVEQRRTNVVNVDINVRQSRKNVDIFNVEFHNFDQHRRKVVNMTIFKKFKRSKTIFLSIEK